MPTADATLLPPPFVDGAATAEDRGSARHLEDVGAHNILGAMIEQKRRASQPSFAAIDVEAQLESDAPSERTPTTSEVFVKAR